MRGLLRCLNPLLIIDAALLVALVCILTSCATLPAPTCANAAKVRAAAVLALQAIDRVCPMGER